MIKRRTLIAVGIATAVVGTPERVFAATLTSWFCDDRTNLDVQEHHRRYDYGTSGTWCETITIVTRIEIEENYDRSIGKPYPLNVLKWIERREGRPHTKGMTA